MVLIVKLTIRKTDIACGLSLGLCSKGTFESFKNENICLAGGAISSILTSQNSIMSDTQLVKNMSS